MLNALTWKLGLDKSEFDRGLLKSKADVKGLESSFASSFKGLAMGGLALAGVGSLTAIGSAAMDLGGELETLSKLAGTTVEDIQRLGAGSKTVGIDMAGLADIYKDVGDKIGDFLQTGAGPMADFFENIAPKVGVTAEMFRELSGPDALQLYHDSLVKAGVSQNEMKFFMEAIASESTRLLPLLENGGKKFQQLGDRAAEAGRIMSEQTAADMKAAQATWANFGRFVTIQSATIASGLKSVFVTNDAELISEAAMNLPSMLGDKYQDLEVRMDAARDALAELSAEGRNTDATSIQLRAVDLLRESYLNLQDTLEETSDLQLGLQSIAAQDDELAKARAFDLSSTADKLKSVSAEIATLTDSISAADTPDSKKLAERERLIKDRYRLEDQLSREQKSLAKESASLADREHKKELSRMDEKVSKAKSTAQQVAQIQMTPMSTSDMVSVTEIGGGKKLVTRREGDRVVTDRVSASGKTISRTRSDSPESAILKAMDGRFEALAEYTKSQLDQLKEINSNGAQLIGKGKK